MVIRGKNGRCIDMGGSGLVKKVVVKHSRLLNQGHSYTSRGTYDAAVIYAEVGNYLYGTSDYHLEVCSSYLSGPNVGFAITGSGATHRCRVKIYDDTIDIDARNDEYAAPDGNSVHSAGNPFAIMVWRMDAGSEIHDNLIRADSSYWGGYGIMLQGATGQIDDTIKIYNNVFQLHSTAPWGTGNCVGIYMRQLMEEGWTSIDNKYIHMYNNEFYITGDTLAATDYRGDNNQGIRLFFPDRCEHIRFENNHIEITGTGLTYCCATSYGKPDSILMEFTQTSQTHTIKNNYYEAPRTPVWLGQGAISDAHANNLRLVGDTIYCSADIADHSFLEFIMCYNEHSTGNWFIDCHFQGYADSQDIIWDYFADDTDYDTCMGQDLTIARVMNVCVLDSTIYPIQSAYVTIENALNDTVSQGYTDITGLYQDTIPVYFYWYDEQEDTCATADSTGFNNYTIYATYEGDADTTEFYVSPDADNSATDTLQLGSTDYSPKKFIAPRK